MIYTYRLQHASIPVTFFENAYSARSDHCLCYCKEDAPKVSVLRQSKRYAPKTTRMKAIDYFETTLVNASDTCRQLLQYSNLMLQQEEADRADRRERQRIVDERYAQEQQEDRKQQQEDRQQQQDMFKQIMGALHDVLSQP